MDSQIDTGYQIPEFVELRRDNWGYPVRLLDILDAEEQVAFQKIWQISDIQLKLDELLSELLFNLDAWGKQLDEFGRRTRPPIRYTPADKVRQTVETTEAIWSDEITSIHEVVSQSFFSLAFIEEAPIGKLDTVPLKLMYLLMGKTAETTGVFGSR